MKDIETQLLYRVAKRYYDDNMLQSEIAAIENISRPQVSKLLTRARELGIVNIEVRMPSDPKCDELQEALQKAFTLESVTVFPYAEAGDDDEDEIRAAALAAAPLLPGLFAAASCIGVGWGRTLYFLANEVPFQRPAPEKTFVPLVGNSGLYNRYLQTSSIADRMSERFGTRCFYMNLSVERQRGRRLSPLEMSVLEELSDLWRRLDAAVFSIGSEGSNYYLKEFPYAIVDRSEYSSSACGEILSQPFFPDGSYIFQGDDYEVSAIHLDALREVPNSVCVAVGRSKAAGIVGAARCGYMKHLITDSLTAEAVLKCL